MRDVLIGTLCGISAVIATALLAPRPQPTPVPIREIFPYDTPESRYEAAAREFLPTTRPNLARVALARPIPPVKVERVAFGEFVKFLADITHTHLSVDWHGLESAGINAQATVTLNLSDVTAAEVLRAALTQLGEGNDAVGYSVRDDGVIKISTTDALARETVTRVYDIRDLIEQAVARSRIGGHPEKTEMTEIEAGDSFSRLMEEAIDPVSWRDAGGVSGGIRSFAGRLVVTQTPENHEMILGLLGALRRTGGDPPTIQKTAP